MEKRTNSHYKACSKQEVKKETLNEGQADLRSLFLIQCFLLSGLHTTSTSGST